MSVSLCVLRIEIDEDLPEMGDNQAESEAAKEQKKRDRGARESKPITVETYASVLMGPNDEGGLLPTSSRRSSPEDTEDDNMISFFCGNPLIEVTKGVLHLYKENELKEAPEARMLCLLSVPGSLGARDLLAFVAACQQDIAHVRVLRDGSPDHYMALLTFRSAEAAREFHSAFDGVPYTSLQPGAVCHCAWVSAVQWARAGAAPPAHTELPTCPVCLERMDESVAGVLSVQCAHAFHATCLLAWSDATCPVCRAASTPPPQAAPRCAACEESPSTGSGEERDRGSGVAEGLRGEVEPGALWICLVCGHVGCGRYEGGHAAQHFLESNHTYALQLGSNRVWDYAGDNFVHRLVQNKPDGKLVAADGERDKQLEFTHLLAAQLTTQREHYLATIHKMEREHAAEREELTARAAAAEGSSRRLQAKLDTLTRDNRALEKKLHTLTARLGTLQSELSEERGLAAAMAANQAEWQAQAQAKEETFNKEVSELKEQLRDVMFFVEARGRLADSPAASAAELADASVTVAPAPPAKPRRRRR